MAQCTLIWFDYLLLPDARSAVREEKHRQRAVVTPVRKQRYLFTSTTEKQNAPSILKETQFFENGKCLPVLRGLSQHIPFWLLVFTKSLSFQSPIKLSLESVLIKHTINFTDSQNYRAGRKLPDHLVLSSTLLFFRRWPRAPCVLEVRSYARVNFGLHTSETCDYLTQKWGRHTTEGTWRISQNPVVHLRTIDNLRNSRALRNLPCAFPLSGTAGFPAYLLVHLAHGPIPAAQVPTTDQLSVQRPQQGHLFSLTHGHASLVTDESTEGTLWPGVQFYCSHLTLGGRKQGHLVSCGLTPKPGNNWHLDNVKLFCSTEKSFKFKQNYFMSK